MNNDTMTLFLATSILAIGGLGIYMFNSNDNKPTKGGRRNKKIVPNDDYESEEESPELETEPEPEPDQEPEEYDDEEYVSRSRGAKTKKSRKQNKGTKRRY